MSSCVFTDLELIDLFELIGLNAISVLFVLQAVLRG